MCSSISTFNTEVSVSLKPFYDSAMKRYSVFKAKDSVVGSSPATWEADEEEEYPNPGLQQASSDNSSHQT